MTDKTQRLGRPVAGTASDLSLQRELDARIRAFIRTARRNDSSSTPQSSSMGFHRPFLRETRHHKSLHFCVMHTQSQMSKRDPNALVIDYTRTMMAFLLFHTRPEHIAIIGLGGGSLAKFCHHELPNSRIDVVEINPHVLALRDEFHVPMDSDRFRVHLGDGAEFISQSRGEFDVLLLDAYTRNGLPAHLSSAEFYRICREALRHNGILVLNLFCPDADAHIDRIRAHFGDAVFVVDEADYDNRVVFACPGRDFEHRIRLPQGQDIPVSASAWATLEPAFSRVVSMLSGISKENEQDE